MNLTLEELEELKIKRQTVRAKAIQTARQFVIIKKVFYLKQSEYKDKIALYNKLDKEYAFALFNREQKKLKTKKESKPYNANKRIAAKALKALEKLPKELRDKIIADAKEGLF